eukprot:1161815-Pelagomonas_calceolata.AAC.4
MQAQRVWHTESTKGVAHRKHKGCGTQKAQRVWHMDSTVYACMVHASMHEIHASMHEVHASMHEVHASEHEEHASTGCFTLEVPRHSACKYAQDACKQSTRGTELAKACMHTAPAR